jgi:phosphate starvation-inducible protein PhoH and related proteins
VSKKKGNGNGNGNNSQIIEKIIKPKISITAKNDNQKLLLKSIKENLITIASGPAGTGKTLLSVVSGLRDFTRDKYKKIIFTRPCVEANGENLGFLPGNLNEKIHPYMYPIFSFLSDYLSHSQIEEYLKEEKIMTLPLAYMRGVTFTEAFVLLDESQNTTPEQVRMFLTRIGEKSKIVLTGDPFQSDVRGKNGLDDACERLCGVEDIGIIRLTKEDIVRSPMVAKIEDRYRENK